MYLAAEFMQPEPVADGVSNLMSAGFGKDEIEIFSDRPIELPGGPLNRRSWTSVAAVSGAVVNGGLATALMYYTQLDYPLNTGGIPTISLWATGIISYELAMAGAVAGLILAFLWESRLLRRRKVRPPSPSKTGSIFVLVCCTEHSAAAAQESLYKAGAADVVRHEAG
jgi:ActD protein